jgi:hypothetical protein
VLLLLMGLIYKIQISDGLRWDDIHTKLHEDWFGHSGNIMVITSSISEVVVLVLLMRATS